MTVERRQPQQERLDNRLHGSHRHPGHGGLPRESARVLDALSAHIQRRTAAQAVRRLPTSCFACLTGPGRGVRFLPAASRKLIYRSTKGPTVCGKMISAIDSELVLNALVGSGRSDPDARTSGARDRPGAGDKESLVAGGKLVMDAAADSARCCSQWTARHSAIFQCLQGEPAGRLKKINTDPRRGAFQTS